MQANHLETVGKRRRRDCFRDPKNCGIASRSRLIRECQAITITWKKAENVNLTLLLSILLSMKVRTKLQKSP